LRARHHNQKGHCQRNQPGDHACQCARNAKGQTKPPSRKSNSLKQSQQTRTTPSEETIASEVNPAITKGDEQRMPKNRSSY